MDDLVMLALIAAFTALYLAHRSFHDYQFDRASLSRFLRSTGQFDQYQPSMISALLMSEQDEREMIRATNNYSLASQSPAISRALSRGVELMIRDFIDPWYRRMSSTQEEFPNDIRGICDHIFNVFASRARRVDWTMFLVRHVVNHLIFLVKIYRLTEKHLSKTNPFFANPHTPEHVRHKLLHAELVQTYRLHPGIIDSEGYLRKVSVALLSQLLPPTDYRCSALRNLFREMMLQYCLKVGMSFSEPYWLNVMLVNALNNVKIEQASQSTMMKDLVAGVESEKNGKSKGKKEPKPRGYAAYRATASGKNVKIVKSYQQQHSQSLSQPPDRGTPVIANTNSAVSNVANSSIASSSVQSMSPQSLSPVLSAQSRQSSPSASAPSSPNPHYHTSSHSRSDSNHSTLSSLTEPSNGALHAGDFYTHTPITELHAGDSRNGAASSFPATTVKREDGHSSHSHNAENEKESLLTAKMAQWNEEREKRQQQQHAASMLQPSQSFDSLSDFKEKPSSSSSLSNNPSLLLARPPVHSTPRLHPQSSLSAVPSELIANGDSRRTRTGLLTLPLHFNPSFAAVPFASITSNWEVRIASAGIRFDPKPYAAYQLDIKNGSTVSLLSWTLEKRYNQFEELHSKLKRAMPQSFDAQLPKKHFFGNLDMEFIRQRKKELEKYLSQLLWNQHVQKSEELREFLIPTEREIKDAKKLMAAGVTAPVTNVPTNTPPLGAASTSLSSTPTSTSLVPNTSVSGTFTLPSPTLSPASFGSQSGPHTPSSPSLVPPLATATNTSTASTMSSGSIPHVPSAASRTRSVTDDFHSGNVVNLTNSTQPMNVHGASEGSRSTTAAGSRNNTGHIVETISESSSETSSLDVTGEAHVGLHDSLSHSPSFAPTVASASLPRSASISHLLTNSVVSGVDHSTSSLAATLSTSPAQSHGLGLGIIHNHFAPLSTPRFAGMNAAPQPPATPQQPTSRANRSTPLTGASTTRSRKGSRAGQSSTSSRSTRKSLEREVGDNLYHLLEEVFDLNHSFVRRTVASTLKQSIKLIFKESINARVKDAITAAVSEQSVVANLEWMTELVWPNGVFRATQPPISDTVKSNTSQQASSLLLESVPTLLTTVLGTAHCDQAIRRFFQFLQMEPLVQHLAYTVLDTFLITLFPELKQHVHT